ncbi:MAG: zf-TFIIB domain-containing protein [Acidobacteriota bacterium]
MIDRPSEKEQEYFLRVELERLKTLRDEHRKKIEQAEREQRKELHYLHCPKCGETMEQTRLEGVEIEVCPDCGGIYLDAGELDKVLDERTRGPVAGALAKLRAIWS